MLKSLQQQFALALQGAKQNEAELKLQDALMHSANLSIYRNNHKLSLTEALRCTYAKIQALVGDDCFKALAHLFIEQEGLKQGDLDLFGLEFGAFLHAQSALNAHPYLADMARLEWLIERLDEKYLDNTPVQAGVLPSDLSQFRLILRPQLSLFSSAFAVVSLFQAIEQKTLTGLKLNESEYCILRKHDDFSVSFIEISEAQYYFFVHCNEGKPLAAMPLHQLEHLEQHLHFALTHDLILAFETGVAH